MDIALFFDDKLLSFDAALDNGLLRMDESLETAVIVSLFTDKRAGNEDELPATETWRRGWWGDSLPALPGDMIGSHLWLLLRCKQTENTRRRAEDYARDALVWMLEDKIAGGIDVAAAWTGPGLLSLDITIHKPEGAGVERYHFGLTTEGEVLRYAV